MLVRAADLAPAKSHCHYYDNGLVVGCVLQVRDEEGRPLGHLVLQGNSDWREPSGRMQHGVTIIPEDTCTF